MKSLIVLTRLMLEESSIWCKVGTHRDIITVTDRVEDEGVSFLTITLPTFALDFERCLARGSAVPSDDFRPFMGWSKSGVLPRFLGGLLEQVFDKREGTVLNEPSIDAIFFVRQICLLHKKVRIDCNERRIRRAFSRYVECDNEVRHHETAVEDLRSFKAVADVLWPRVLGPAEERVFAREVVPRHGPGATAEKLLGNKKFTARNYHQRLENYFPPEVMLLPNESFFCDLFKRDFIKEDDEQPQRLIAVPKTLKGPRLIAIEPVCMQYAQQALLREVEPLLTNSKVLRGALGFRDQHVNNVLAQQGSRDGSLATLDLSEASDRVPLYLCVEMLSSLPHLRQAIVDCRSTRVDIPGHGVVPLAKFASMGSALCFPIESMVFLTIILSGLHRRDGVRPTQASINRYLGSLRIFGDDIICRSDDAKTVMAALQAFGLVVNAHKSFWTGKFRESCGRDYYDGVDITCVYNRSPNVDQTVAGNTHVSVVEHRNLAYKRGLWHYVAHLDEVLMRKGPYPVVLETSAVLGRHSFLGYSIGKWNSQLHRFEVRGFVVHAPLPTDPLEGGEALLKCLYMLEFADKSAVRARVEHLTKAGRPLSVRTKAKWALSY